MKKIVIILTCLFNSYVTAAEVSDVTTLHYNPCVGNPGIRVDYTPSVEPGVENQYEMVIAGVYLPQARVILSFDAEATITLAKGVLATVDGDNRHKRRFDIIFYKFEILLQFTVQGSKAGVIPYINSIKMWNIEFCTEPSAGFLDQFLHLNQQKVSPSCGRRGMEYKELIVNGASTLPGDWPWHAAVYKQDRGTLKYICGGTLLSDKIVLTAAHCTTEQGVKVLPEILNVVLGKYNLNGGDVPTQERTVHEIIVHEKFTKKNLDHDIALLKLRIVVVFNTFVRPICMWNDDVANSLASREIKGNVVGWGYNVNNTLSAQLTQTMMTIMPETICIRKQPLFYSTQLTEYKFCAGADKGVSPCNGDSGGGFVVFVPDSLTNAPGETGSYYIRGLVSTTVAMTTVSGIAVCDPDYYVVFTDVAKYRTWIEDNIKD